MNQGIILQNNQWFQGSGLPMAVSSSFGPETIPAQTAGNPLIAQTNSGTPTVTAASGNIINGFNIAADFVGIQVGDVVGTTITNNTFVSSVADINIGNLLGSGFTGSAIVQNNTSANGTGVTYDSAGASTLNFSNNNMFQLLVNINNNGNFIGTIDSNTLTDAFTANLSNTSVSTLNINDNVVVNNTTGLGAFGIFTNDTASLTFNFFRNVANTTNQTGLTLIAFDTTFIAADIENNTTLNAPLSGQRIGSGDFSTVTLRLNQNTASSVSTPPTGSPYFLTRNGSAFFEVQSPNLQLSGVQAINTGTIDNAGPSSVTFIPFQ
jgi:hypothetical protein